MALSPGGGAWWSNVLYIILVIGESTQAVGQLESPMLLSQGECGISRYFLGFFK